MLALLLLLPASPAVVAGENGPRVPQILARVAAHDFHPLNDGQGFTLDRSLKQRGIADLDDNDWKVRLLAVRDLVRAGGGAAAEIISGMRSQDEDVRQVSAMALGILRGKQGVGELERAARNDENAMVRSQAVIALGQIESTGSLEFLREQQKNDPSRDVRYQCGLAIDQIEKRMGTTDAQLKAFQRLDESTFETLRVGHTAPDFSLSDTEGKAWRLSDFRGKKWVLLIWVFADWCPVCHGEFHDLMASKEAFEESQVQVFTIECHDRYRGRVMVGKELEPEHWFAKQSFKDTYTKQIWWPHLLDRAGAVGAMYGVDPMAFAVHAEYINRPSTVIVDKEGVVQLAYYGTFWGDRPTIAQTLNMIKSGQFDFEHPKRLQNPAAGRSTGRMSSQSVTGRTATDPAAIPLTPQVGQKAPDFTLTTLDGKPVQLSKQLADGPVVLVVLRGWPGYQCPICTRQVGEFIARAEQFKAANARVILVYPGPADHLMDHAQEFVSGKDIPANFSFVIDPDFKLTVSYGLRWDAPRETAYPSTFVVDRKGVVRFAKVSKTHGDRASAKEVLAVVAGIKE